MTPCMTRSPLFLILSLCLVWPASAFASCDEPYGQCMSQCATSNTPERCMQRCQQSLQRCSKSGVFQMSIGFRVSSPPRLDARAQAVYPDLERAKRPRR